MIQPYYWQAVSEAGVPCGHKHRYFTRAVSCARGWERYLRNRYNVREVWCAERVEL